MKSLQSVSETTSVFGIMYPKLNLSKPNYNEAAIPGPFENQLSSLLDTLSSSSAHFIRCVVPNYERVPNKVDGPLVLNQLRCNGVLEGIRICREGYPSRLPFADFVQRYRMFAKEALPNGRGADEICVAAGMDPLRYQIGKTKIFCKIGVVSELEAKRKEHINGGHHQSTSAYPLDSYAE
ncbi:hypothetical protein OSTOST_14357, partial [Ostertagia ostertagi]